MESIKHHNLCLSNSTVNWVPTDTEELYLNNLNNPVQRTKLEKDKWVNANITYKHNSHGFRTGDFDTNTKNFISIGCSFTYGTGLPVDIIWPELLSNKLNLPVYNLGLPGSSSDTCYRIVENYVPLLKPKFVVMLEPELNRLEIFKNNNPYIHVPRDNDVTGITQSLWVKYWVSNEVNSIIHAKKNVNAIAYICKKYNVEFYRYSDNFFLKFWNEHFVDFARDLQHPGRVFHEQFANYVHQDILNKCTYE